MGQYIRGSGIWKEEIEKVVERRYGGMAQNLLAIGRMIKQMERAASSTQTAMFMKVNGSTTRPKARVRMSIVTELSLSAIGLKIGNMALALRSGPTMPNLRAILNKERSTVWEPSDGTMAQSTSASFTTTISTGKAFTLGVTVGNMRVTGERIRCMEKACSLGPTAANTSASTETTRKRAMASLFGLMAGAIEVSGPMASRMAKEHMFRVAAKKSTGSGKTERGLDGWVGLRENDHESKHFLNHPSFAQFLAQLIQSKHFYQ